MDKKIQFNKNDVEKWVNDFTDYLYNWAYYKVKNIHIAEDLVQETFLIALKQINKFEGKSSPKTWLTSILNNLILEYYRQKIKNNSKVDADISDYFSETGHWIIEKLPQDFDENINILDDIDFTNVFDECLDKLPIKYQIIIKYKYLSNKKADDICKELGITQTNYWQLIHRGKLSLRECLEKNYFSKKDK